MVKTFRDEVTDRLIFYGENDLRRVLAEYVEYYNTQRPHSSLEFNSPTIKFERKSVSDLKKIKRNKILYQLCKIIVGLS